MRSVKDCVDFLSKLSGGKNLVKVNSELFSKVKGHIVKGISDSSLTIEPGFIFIALKGYQTHGHKYIPSLLSKNPLYIILNQDYFSQYADLAFKNDVLLIGVHDTGAIVSFFCAFFYNFPSRKVRLIGVTGTNGKTSISYLLNKILLYAKYQVLLIGTYGIFKNGEFISPSLTTPTSFVLQKLFYEAYQEGIQIVIMEISSHGIFLNRIDGCDYDVIIFSSFSRDHLDFHSSLEDYFSTKLLILDYLKISSKKNKIFIFNADINGYSKRLLEKVKSYQLRFEMYSLEKLYLENEKINYFLLNYQIKNNGVQFSFYNDLTKQNHTLFFSLLGKYNIANLISIVATLDFLGVSLDEVKDAIKHIQIPGRYQTIFLPSKNSYIVVDYAHTDHALRNILESIRNELNPKKLIVIFGCGGDRDQGKRKLMAQAVSQFADLAIVTNDNPRYENEEKIALDIIAGFPNNFHYIKLLNRFLAIKKGIQCLEQNTVLLIAGKGHETDQIIRDQKISFNDFEVVMKML